MKWKVIKFLNNKIYKGQVPVEPKNEFDEIEFVKGNLVFGIDDYVECKLDIDNESTGGLMDKAIRCETARGIFNLPLDDENKEFVFV